MDNKIALIAGATGLVGRFCLSYLLMDPQYKKIIVLSRKPLPIRDSKIENISVEFDQLASVANQLHADDVFCCLGTTIALAGSQDNFKKVDLQYPVDLARIVKKNGAKNFLVISAMGAGPHSKIFYNKVKGEMQDQIQSIGFQTLHIFQPSLLTGLRKEFRLGERIAQASMKLFTPLMIGGLKKYKPIDAMVVAFAMHQQAKEIFSGHRIYTSDAIQEIFDQGKK